MSSKSELELEELRAEAEQQGVLLQKLSDQIKKLSDQINPAPRPPSTQAPIDRTEKMRLPDSAQRDMFKVGYPGLADDLAADRARRRVTSSPAPEPQRQRGSGWAPERPLEPAGGQSTIAACDRLVDAQDKIDRAELIERHTKAAQTEAAMKQAEGPTDE